VTEITFRQEKKSGEKIGKKRMRNTEGNFRLQK